MSSSSPTGRVTRSAPRASSRHHGQQHQESLSSPVQGTRKKDVLGSLPTSSSGLSVTISYIKSRGKLKLMANFRWPIHHPVPERGQSPVPATLPSLRPPPPPPPPVPPPWSYPKPPDQNEKVTHPAKVADDSSHRVPSPSSSPKAKPLTHSQLQPAKPTVRQEKDHEPSSPAIPSLVRSPSPSKPPSNAEEQQPKKGVETVAPPVVVEEDLGGDKEEEITLQPETEMSIPSESTAVSPSPLVNYPMTRSYVRTHFGGNMKKEEDMGHAEVQEEEDIDPDSEEVVEDEDENPADVEDVEEEKGIQLPSEDRRLLSSSTFPWQITPDSLQEAFAYASGPSVFTAWPDPNPPELAQGTSHGTTAETAHLPDHALDSTTGNFFLGPQRRPGYARFIGRSHHAVRQVSHTQQQQQQQPRGGLLGEIGPVKDRDWMSEDEETELPAP